MPEKFIAWLETNGSGKSTLIKIMAGVYRPDGGGRIVVKGRTFDHLSPYQAKKLGIQVIYQDLSLFPNLSVWKTSQLIKSLAHRFHLSAARPCEPLRKTC